MTETEIQVQVVRWLNSLKSKNFEFFATLNEALLKGSAGQSQGVRYHLYQKLLKMGLKTGIPDLVFLCDGGKAFFIEMKAEKGTLSKNQKFRIPILQGLGFSVHICKNLDCVKEALLEEEII